MHGIQNFRNSFSILIPCRLQQAIRLFKGCYDILPVFTHNRVTEFSANLCIGNKYSRPLLIKCKVSQMYQKRQPDSPASGPVQPDSALPATLLNQQFIIRSYRCLALRCRCRIYGKCIFLIIGSLNHNVNALTYAKIINGSLITGTLVIIYLITFRRSSDYRRIRINWIRCQISIIRTTRCLSVAV